MRIGQSGQHHPSSSIDAAFRLTNPVLSTALTARLVFYCLSHWVVTGAEVSKSQQEVSKMNRLLLPTQLCAREAT